MKGGGTKMEVLQENIMDVEELEAKIAPSGSLLTDE